LAIRLALGWILVVAGCLPFFGSKGEPPRTSLSIQRFATAADELGLPPSPLPLSDATSMLADAVESLPNSPGGHERAQKIAANAHAMHGVAAEDEPLARTSLALAVSVLQEMKKPAGSKKEREQALQAVEGAIGMHDRYRAVARAMVLFSGGVPGVPGGSTLRALVARLSVENDDIARRTIAEALVAMADQLQALRLDPGDLRQRAAKLTGVPPLEYAPELRDALDRVVALLRRPPPSAPAFATFAADAHDAVERVRRDRPFELQRAATQDALRLITCALTIASPTTNSGR
jgi:hypothetical protein